MSTATPSPRENLATGIHDGMLAILRPGSGLDELRREMQRRNLERVLLYNYLWTGSNSPEPKPKRLRTD